MANRTFKGIIIIIMDISGIYKIQSIIKPERIYIGSSMRINARWKNHLSWLRLNHHINKKLQNHFNKYGESDLIFSVVTTCDINELIEKEQFFIDSYKPYFNLRPKAESNLGYKASEETRLKISKAGMGRVFGEESRKKMSQSRREYNLKHGIRPPSRKGKKMSPEAVKKMSVARKGKSIGVGHKQSPETIAKRVLKLRGQKRSEEFKKQLGMRSKGHIISDETRAKMSESHIGIQLGEKHPMFGKKHSEETRRKMSESKKKLFKDKAA